MSMMDVSFVFQPIYDPKTGKVFFYEILTRFNKEKLDVESFFNNVNENYIKELAIKQLHYIVDSRFPYQVSINIDLCYLNDAGFVKTLTSFHEVKFCVEINRVIEPHVYNQKIIDNLFLLNSHGIGVWLDDYVENFSPNQYSLTIWDYIKIDKSVVAERLTSPETVRLLMSKLKIYTKFGFIFESVETKEQEMLFHDENVLLQGFLFSKPKSLELLANNDDLALCFKEFLS